MKLFKFIIEENQDVEININGIVVGLSGFLGVALADTKEQAKNILWHKSLEFGFLPAWLEYAEVIEIPIDAAGYVAFAKVGD